jgi:DNA-binding GntR family transcriptional regulator
MVTTPDTEARETPRAPQIATPPSLVDLAAGTLRRMIMSGQLLPGERVVENQLKDDLGISRPPLREALRILEREGLVLQQPRRGVIVTPLTLHDVYEIFTLRREIERFAVRLAVPVRDPLLLDRCRTHLAAMEESAKAGDEARHAERAFEFHAAVIGLAGHRRLEDAYRRMQMQMLLCMAMNRRARGQVEDLAQDSARHRRLLETLERGDAEEILAELSHHGDRTFLDGIEERLGGHTEISLAWLERIREGKEDL